ncbi:hypothetical protein [Streptomyces aureus]|nr:hypothetical protein [Streptomyces aureus]
MSINAAFPEGPIQRINLSQHSPRRDHRVGVIAHNREPVLL